jgi:hypothetical protein
MSMIPGVIPERVKIHGPRFLQLVENARKFYEDMKETPPDPNHQNVIDISSDDEDPVDEVDQELDDDELSTDEYERSAYFAQPPEVAAFNAQCEHH